MITQRARSLIRGARALVVALAFVGTALARPLPIALLVAALGYALWYALGMLAIQHDTVCTISAAYQRAVEAQKRAVRSRDLLHS